MNPKAAQRLLACSLGIPGNCQEILDMAKYGKAAQREVKKAVSKQKEGKQRSGKKGKAKSRKQAIAIGLSKARKKWAKVPKKKTSKRKTTKKK